MSGIADFARGSVRQVLSGGRAYKAWMAALLAMIAVGAVSYAHQARVGLIASNMRDDVSWAFYIGNFTFLVGVAAAADWAGTLIHRGKSPDTPVAVVRRCSWSDQSVIRCTLDAVAEEVARQGVRPPAV